MFNPGSEIPFITNKLVNQHWLQNTRSTLTITDVGGLSKEPVLYRVALTLQARVSEFSLGISAFSMGRVTNSLSSFELQNQYWDHLQGPQFTDPEFLVPSDIDILLGLDVYEELIQSEVRKGGPHDPVTQLTYFRWVSLGPSEDRRSSQVHRRLSHLMFRSNMMIFAIFSFGFENRRKFRSPPR